LIQIDLVDDHGRYNWNCSEDDSPYKLDIVALFDFGLFFCLHELVGEVDLFLFSHQGVILFNIKFQ